MDSHRIGRKEYLEKLAVFRDKQMIKVITGVRRCGKSTLMEIYQNYLKESGVEEAQIVTVNLEDYDFYELRDPEKLHIYIEERLVPGKMTYIFLDEIQQCEDFPKVVDYLYTEKDTDVYITGSGAYMLSAEMAATFAGRYVEIKMFPLSFKEYVESTGDTHELYKKYTAYLESSSFPHVLELEGQAKEIKSYLDGIYNSIVVKDIAGRHRISDAMMLESIVRFILDNIGNQLSTKKVADYLTATGRKIDVKTVEKYLAALIESCILYQAKRYNVRGKQYLRTLEKYYAVDIGMRDMLLGARLADEESVLENVVYLELLRRGYDVYVGKIDDQEVDFVCMEQNGMVYYQAAVSVKDKKMLKRELGPLQKIPDNYPKYILTLDEGPEADYEGIRRINVLEWLIAGTP